MPNRESEQPRRDPDGSQRPDGQLRGPYPQQPGARVLGRRRYPPKKIQESIDTAVYNEQVRKRLDNNTRASNMEKFMNEDITHVQASCCSHGGSHDPLTAASN